MHVKDYYKTLNISLLFWHQSFTNIFTGKLILPMVLPLNRWYGKSFKFTTLLTSYLNKDKRSYFQDIDCDPVPRLCASESRSGLRHIHKLEPYGRY